MAPALAHGVKFDVRILNLALLRITCPGQFEEKHRRHVPVALVTRVDLNPRA